MAYESNMLAKHCQGTEWSPNLEVGKWISSIENTKYPCVNVWGPRYEICAVESCIYFPFKILYGGSSANLNERDKDLAYTGPF